VLEGIDLLRLDDDGLLADFQVMLRSLTGLVPFAQAVRENPALRGAVLVWNGHVNHEGIAREAGLAYTPLSDSDLA